MFQLDYRHPLKPTLYIPQKYPRAKITLTLRASLRNSERRRIQVVLPYGVGAASTSASGSRGVGGADLLDSPVTTALEAQLNEARRVKRGRDLRCEQQVFLSRLAREREERIILEAWAASRVQALFRGFLARPRPRRLRRRQILTPAESNRRLVADLQLILAHAGLPTIPGVGPDGRKALDGSNWARGRGVVTRARGGGGPGNRGVVGFSRPRSRKQRAFESEMSTRITKVVRGFLERTRYTIRWIEWDEQRRLASTILIQHAWRSYRKRMGWKELEAGVMDQAATEIQAHWRGMSCRMALIRKGKEEDLWARKTVSAITIQAAARRRLAAALYGPRLTLGAARRRREARAAAEAARPRRRWNRGGPKESQGGDDSLRQSVGFPRISGKENRASLVSANEEGGRGKQKKTVTLPSRKKSSSATQSIASPTRIVGKGCGDMSKGRTCESQSETLAATTVQTGAAGASSLTSPEKKLTQQEPALGWGPGLRKVETSEPPVGNVAPTVTPDPANRECVFSSAKKETERKEKRSSAVRFAPQVDTSPSEVNRRASKEVGLLFVQGSIQAAVVSAGNAPKDSEAFTTTPSARAIVEECGSIPPIGVKTEGTYVSERQLETEGKTIDGAIKTDTELIAVGLYPSNDTPPHLGRE